MTDEAVETVVEWRKAWAPYINDGVKVSIDSLVQRLREAEERATYEGTLREQTADALHKVTLRAEAAEERADHWQHQFHVMGETAHRAEERAEKAEAFIRGLRDDMFVEGEVRSDAGEFLGEEAEA